MRRPPTSSLSPYTTLFRSDALPAWRGQDSIGRLSLRVPATDIEETIIKSLKQHVAANQDNSTTNAVGLDGHGALTELVAGVVVYRNNLIVTLKSSAANAAS